MLLNTKTRIWMEEKKCFLYENDDYIINDKGIIFLTKPASDKKPQVIREMYFQLLKSFSLADSMNKDIFAQDFVSYMEPGNKTYLGKVLIFDGVWGIYNKYNSFIMSLEACVKFHNAKVVGNTYETPSLYEFY